MKRRIQIMVTFLGGAIKKHVISLEFLGCDLNLWHQLWFSKINTFCLETFPHFDKLKFKERELNEQKRKPMKRENLRELIDIPEQICP